MLAVCPWPLCDAALYVASSLSFLMISAFPSLASLGGRPLWKCTLAPNDSLLVQLMSLSLFQMPWRVLPLFQRYLRVREKRRREN